MTHGDGRAHARGGRFLAKYLSLGAGLLLAAVPGCRTTNALSAEAPSSYQFDPRDPTAELLASLRREADEREATNAGAIMRGEDVASFVEERGTLDDPAAAREAFDAWSRARAQESGRSSRTIERTISRLQARLESTIAARGEMLQPGRLTFAAVKTGSSSPSVISAPTAEARLVLLDDRLFDMVYAVVSTALGSGLEGVPPSCEAVADALRSQSLVKPRFSVSLRYSAGAARTGRYDLAPRNAAQITALVRSAELFLMAHEYAHVLLGHAPAAGVARVIAAANTAPTRATEAVYGWDQQFAADTLAFQLVQETVRRDGTQEELALAWYGPEVMLFTMALLDEARAVLAGEKAPPTSGELVEASLLRPSAHAQVVTSALPGVGTRSGAPLWARRAALRENMRRSDHEVAGAPGWDAASFVERMDACIFANVSTGLARLGESRRSVDRVIEALRLTPAESRRD